MKRVYEIVGDKIWVFLNYEDRFIAKAIRGYWWKQKEKCWQYPLNNETVELLNHYFNLGIMEAKPLTEVNEPLIEEEISLAEYNSPVRPFDHQRRAVALMFKHKTHGLFLQMGAGKTKCVVDWYRIAFAKSLIDGMLVVCPKSVIPSWIDELNKHGLKDAYVVLDGTSTQRIKKIDLKKINIINYAGIAVLAGDPKRSKPDYLQQFNYDRFTIILDESSKIKNPKALRTKLVVKSFTLCTYKFILTGTPITQNPIDVYPQFKFLNPDYLGFKNWYSFRNYYCIMGGHMRYEIVGYKHLPELKNKIHEHAYVLAKKDCLDLPDKIYKKFHLEMFPDMLTQYKQMSNKLMLEVSEDKTITASIILVKLLRLQQILSGVWLPDQKHNYKMNQVIEIITKFSGDQKVIIWCKFIESIDLIAKELGLNSVGYVKFYGATKDRAETIETFRNDKDCKVFIGQLQTGGMGINLQCASMMIYFENSFSLQDRLQSEDRAHRPGQKNNVTYIDLIYKNTMDENIIDAIDKKERIANNLVPAFKGEKKDEYIADSPALTMSALQK